MLFLDQGAGTQSFKGAFTDTTLYNYKVVWVPIYTNNSSKDCGLWQDIRF